jgi:anti-sigma factor RsiW
MKDQWTERLSDYLDEEMATPEREALEAHLAACVECSTTLLELRRVVGRARALDDQPPATDLWPTIARRIGVETSRRRPVRRFTVSVPQLLAASIAVIIASGGTVWLAMSRRAGPLGQQPAATSTAAVARVSWTSDTRYDAAIAQLQSALEDGRKSGRLDSTTVRVVEHSLAIIDTAIAQARRALVLDPGSSYLNRHLAETMQRKIQLLRGAAALATART